MILGLLTSFVTLCFGSTSFISNMLLMLVRLATLASKALGLVIMTTLYGWYGFDPFW
jgi:hypothetical protein